MITDTLECLVSPGWMAHASCRYTDPDVFYPSTTGHWNKGTMEAAFKICRTCPVAVECLNWAFEINDAHAILGGTTPEMRGRMVREAA